jgi:hypothetical protein
MNDDRFIMEKISATIEMDDSEDEQLAMRAARGQIIENFKAAYPNVFTYLNFDVTEQRNIPITFVDEGGYGTPLTGALETTTIPTEKVNKGTLEEQIQACTTEHELCSFNLIAKMNPKLSELYDNQLFKIRVVGTNPITQKEEPQY